MQNNNGYQKYLAIIALLISVVGVSLGFAAYSNTLQIKAQADVSGRTPDPVAELSTSPSSQQDGPVTPTTTGGASAEVTTLDEDSLENIKVHFTSTGQSATYSFYGVNSSSFVSYLNSVVFGTKSCAADNTNGNPATVGVDTACGDITMTIAAGAEDFTETNNNVNGHAVNGGTYEPVTVTIEYIDGGAVADGDFTVDFGTSTLNYSTVD